MNTFIETIEQVIQPVEVEEGQDVGKGERRIRAIGVTADVVNGNRRRYPKAVLTEALGQLTDIGSGRLMGATGEVEHPSAKTGKPQVLETVIRWDKASLNEQGQVELEGAILPTSKGKDLAVLVESKVPIGISMRGEGLTESRTEGRSTYNEVTQLTIRGWDVVDVNTKSDPTAQILESQEQVIMDPKEQDKQKAPAAPESPSLDESIVKERDALKAKLEEAQKAQEKLAEIERKQAIDEAIIKATDGLKYGSMNAEFVEAVRAANPETPEAVKPLVEAKMKEWDGIFAKMKLGGMGDVQVLGPVFERETGQPEWSKAAYELTEALVASGQGTHFKTSDDDWGAKRFAREYLKRFDALYKHKLIQEARQFEEAETVSDLNLPYSVSRAIVSQVFPQLVAANIFDFGTADQSPARIYYETYAAETGAEVAVVEEEVTADLNNWVSLAHKAIKPGSITVTNDAGAVTYTENSDYLIDLEAGRIMAIATITDNQAILVTYTYNAIRQGEMTEIERAKQTLAYKTIEFEADRLATQVSREAVVFSRAQLGYDATTRAIAGIVRKVRNIIDERVFRAALNASLQQANNSGGTWTSASDALSILVQYIGYAKVKVSGRYYTPTSILMSEANADVLSNWDGFKRDGFPNAVMSAAGFAGSVKGLPIFTTTEFTDGYILVVNRELVAHRVFQPMQLMGPYPTYGANQKMVAAEQYYIEEFNGTDVPVIQKAAHVKIA